MSGAAFESRSTNIAALLGEDQKARVVVPPFQRGYSWNKKHVQVFWEDLIRFLERSRQKGGPDKYFLGPIVVRHEGNDFIHLLDGQQRIATATILFSLIRDSARAMGTQVTNDFAAQIQSRFISKMDADGEDTGLFSLEMGEMDRVYFSETIQRDPPNKKRNAATKSERTIKAARNFLEKALSSKVDGLDPAAKLSYLKRLKLALQRDLVMACIPVDSERDAFTIFETLNDRGLRLSAPDLLLNYLMREARPETDRRHIRDVWNEMLEQMGRRDINRFFRHMWISMYGDLKNVDLFTALRDLIEERKIGSLSFVTTCSDECVRYVQLFSADKDALGQDAAQHVEVLVGKLDIQASLPLLLACHKVLEVTDLARVARWLLVYVTRYQIIGDLDPSGLENLLFRLARDVRTKVDQGTTEKECVHLIRDTLEKNAPSDEDTKRNAAKVVLSADEASYVMNRLANYIQSKTKEVKMSEANIEHIYPKNPKDSEWGGKKNHKTMNQVLWHIGNLTVFGKRLNQGAGNKEFPDKKKEYATKTEVVMTKRIASQFSKETDWTVSCVERRGKELAALVPTVWNFKNPSRV